MLIADRNGQQKLSKQRIFEFDAKSRRSLGQREVIHHQRVFWTGPRKSYFNKESEGDVTPRRKSALIAGYYPAPSYLSPRTAIPDASPSKPQTWCWDAMVETPMFPGPSAEAEKVAIGHQSAEVLALAQYVRRPATHIYFVSICSRDTA
jgi:hypothetical protein